MAEYEHKTETAAWTRGDAEAEYYHEAIERSKENALAQHGSGPDKKTIKPEEMPWEDSPQGRIKHIINGPLADELGTAV
ncbi:MAG: hypothetical protein R3324_13245, partial [Halobacteriales archaeon]|nr:hypothetical protein [Halobacteriales archaeon]